MSVEENLMQDYKAYSGSELADNIKKANMYDIVSAIKTVSDPEIMINVYDLGLIYKINQQESGDVFIDMTLTAPTCPVAGVLPQEVADAVAKTEGVGKVEVKVVWEPVWSIERLSDEAKAMLDMF
ncbi:MAG: DUF59 domain-containing protein [Alphaproteobacteria bacterium]|nr:DUF59 domain-containing protein [Alphaproteobacteria bacterium]